MKIARFLASAFLYGVAALVALAIFVIAVWIIGFLGTIVLDGTIHTPIGLRILCAVVLLIMVGAFGMLFWPSTCQAENDHDA